MNTYKAIIQYSGTDFKGFQKQNSGVLTIQNTLEDVLQKICSDQELKTIGSGRTDAGVHADCQVIKISTHAKIPAKGLLKSMNDLLPVSIRVVQLDNCLEDFHPIRDALDKEYHYRFSFNQTLDPSVQQYCTNFFGELDIELMKASCELFVGTHDFLNYQTVGTDVESTVREILACEIRSKEMISLLNGERYALYELRIRGTGFLKQMVRLIMGALVEVGKGKVENPAIINSLSAIPLKNRLGPVAPPQGLILYKVNYPIS